jgi:hypothetical protein
LRRDEADVGLAAAGDEELLARRSALHVPAEAVPEVVGADDAPTRLNGRVELVGLEPTASTVPPWRSAQLSYSPR